ncbi:MAG: hypothetical protein HY914_13985 [Desulfomonile tiedjei]|nr:hypothetical protein [Desulfomonile tiedjei]
MNGADPGETSNATNSSSSALAPFEELLATARARYESADLDGALDILLGLEKRYLAATPLFELLGNVCIKRGDLRRAVRYKTLYEMICAALNVERRAEFPESESLAVLLEKQKPVEKRMEPPCAAKEDEIGPPPTHFTAAMGHELMKQGHYGQALHVFNVLVEKNPEDGALREAREKARRKARERHVVGILERWLDNVQRLTADRAPRR